MDSPFIKSTRHVDARHEEYISGHKGISVSRVVHSVTQNPGALALGLFIVHCPIATLPDDPGGLLVSCF